MRKRKKLKYVVETQLFLRKKAEKKNNLKKKISTHAI